MAKGYILVHRQIWDNRIWNDDEPFDKRSAWIDLLLMANHADKDMLMGLKVVNFKRGQIHTSCVNLAKRWHWSRNRVARYLRLLSELGMISLSSATNGTTRGTTITVIKYGLYQDWRSANGATNEAANEATREATNGAADEATRGAYTKNVRKNVLKNGTKNVIKNEEYYKRPAGDRSSSLKAWEELERRIEGNG